jgi:hypothetical protein
VACPRYVIIASHHLVGAHPWPPRSSTCWFSEFLEWAAIGRNRPATTVRAYRQDLAKFAAFLVSTGGRTKIEWFYLS